MKLKKVLSLILAIAMIAAVAVGCSNQGQTQSDNSSQKTDSSSQKADSSSQGSSSTKTDVEETDGIKQAPMLDSMGLDSVSDRIPTNYVTLIPNSVGVYGGTYYGAFPTAYRGQAWQTLGFFEPMIGWNQELTELVPNTLEEFSYNEDATVFTCKIREGLKWSDGAPVTTEDVRYLVEDVWGNTDLYSTPPSNYMAGGEMLKLDVIDDYSFTITFAVPNPSFTYLINQEDYSMLKPSHYMKQFNSKYVDVDELNALADEKGYDTWTAMYTELERWYENPEYPTLYAWTVKSISDDGLVHTCERNPYYFKVDSEGNQLPYMDYCQVEYVDNTETLNLKIMSGEVDYISAPPGESLVNYPMFAENAAAGNYTVALASDDFTHKFNILPNHSNQDPQKGPLLSDKNFRIALSHAINREELVNLFGSVGDIKATIAQQSPKEGSPYYHEELSTQYIEYDAELANKMLDELGLTERDGDGYRLGLDGNKMVFSFIIPTYDDSWIDIGTRVSDYWKEVGINVEVQAVDPTIWDEAVKGNTFEFTGLSSGSGGMMMATKQHINAYGLSTTGWDQRWAYSWAEYYVSGGKSGIEPPEYIYELNDLQQKVLQTTDAEELKTNIKAFLDKRAEIFPTISTFRTMPQFFIVHNDIQNAPEEGEPWVIFAYGVGANVNPCMFYKN